MHDLVQSRDVKKLEFTPLEFETLLLKLKLIQIQILEFTPLEFET